MSLRLRQRIPVLLALPASLFTLYVLAVDQGNSGAWGFVYNRFYIVLAWGLLFCTTILMSRRPWFAAGLASTVLSGLWIGAWIKFQFLGSQLTVLDLAVAVLSAETLLEMGLLPTLVICSYLLLLVLSAILEKPRQYWDTKALIISLSTMAVLFSLLNSPLFEVDLQWTSQKKLTFPILVQSIWRARLTEPQQTHKATYCCFKADLQAETFTQTPNKKPNILVILEESTFPAEEILNFKASKQFFKEAYPLKVHTVGGSTWVQEISFLHGVAPPLYGNGWQAINLFAPGHLDGRIARQLAAQGYATKTIYPIAGRFYGGQRFHQQLGIQDFIDCKAMPECAKRKWNKMPDEVFFDEAVKQVKLNDKPVFAFIATMRQHSPHEKGYQYDTSRCQAGLSAEQCSIMLDYDARLKLSLNAYEGLLAQLKKLPERTIVVAFGDHIPGDVAANFTEEQFYKQDRFRTFFNVWDSAQGYVTHKVLDGQEFETIDVAMLDALTMRYAGFESRYLTDKLVHMQECSGSFCGFGIDNVGNDNTALTQLQTTSPALP